MADVLRHLFQSSDQGMVLCQAPEACHQQLGRPNYDGHCALWAKARPLVSIMICHIMESMHTCTAFAQLRFVYARGCLTQVPHNRVVMYIDFCLTSSRVAVIARSRIAVLAAFCRQTRKGGRGTGGEGGRGGGAGGGCICASLSFMSSSSPELAVLTILRASSTNREKGTERVLRTGPSQLLPLTCLRS